MMKTMVRLTRGEPMDVVMPDSDEVVEVPPCTAGQYRAALALEAAEGMDFEESITRQCALLVSEEVAARLTPTQCAQLVRAVVCQYHGINPEDDKRVQELLKKKALADLLLEIGTRRASSSAAG